MKTIPSRQLTAKPGDVWKTLREDGAVVVTRDGHAFSILLPTSDETLVEDIQELVFSRARRAVSAIRSEAQASGTASMGMDDIDAEIKATRQSTRSAPRHA